MNERFGAGLRWGNPRARPRRVFLERGGGRSSRALPDQELKEQAREKMPGVAAYAYRTSMLAALGARRPIAHHARNERRRAVADREEPKIAVALKYSKEVDSAPRVIAKGMRLKADKILEIAKMNGVPVMRNVPLAETLNRLEVGTEIPEELYDAVAEVLNYVSEIARAEGRS
jgi:flagellar biosynthesis protein